MVHFRVSNIYISSQYECVPLFSMFVCYTFSSTHAAISIATGLFAFQKHTKHMYGYMCIYIYCMIDSTLQKSECMYKKNFT